MEVTFYNRQLRIALLYLKSGDRMVFDNLFRLSLEPNNKGQVIFIPIEENENNEMYIAREWIDFLSKFDPDFIAYNEDIDESLLNNLRRTIPVFKTVDGEEPENLPGSFSNVPDEERNGTVENQRKKIPINLIPPMEKLSQPLHKSNVTTYYYVDGFPQDGRIKIPGNIDKNRVFDIIIRDNNNIKEGYILPQNTLVKRVLSRFNPEMEIRPMGYRENSGFSIIAKKKAEDNTVVQFPHPDTVIQEMFNEAGYATHPARTNTFINMFSSLREAGEFLTKSYTLPLIERMKNHKGKYFGEVRKIISSRGIPDSVETSEELLFMLSRRFLLRGFILKCDCCHLEDFYFIKEVDEKYICRGCRSENLTPLKLPSAYRLNRIVLDGLRNGVIATVLTLYRLYREAGESFIYSPELGLKSGGTEMEIDIVSIVDGRIIIGEAKMGRLIKDRDFSRRDEFEKYKKLAVEINAHRVIFSTIKDSFYDIPMSKIDRFRRELIEEGFEDVEVDIFGGSELFRK